MKTSGLFMVAMLIGSAAIAQKVRGKDVPVIVRASLQKQYPDVAKIKWSKEGGNYEAEFNFKNEEFSVLMDASGNIKETEIEIMVIQLPEEITQYINTNYTGQSVKEAAKITDANGVVTFEVEVKGKDLIFDSTGKFIRETKD